MSENIQSFPLITIGITCYNAESTILRAIKSAEDQDWDNKEIVIVDDCSSDRSIEIIQSYIKDKPFTHLVQHEVNQGTAGARNTILKNANGEFIAFFDDDDESLPTRLQTQFKRISDYETQTQQTNIACYCSGHRQYSNGYQFELKAVGSKPRPPVGEEIANYVLFFKKESGVFYGNGTPTCSLMARKSTFKNIGGFSQDFRRLEDVDFAIKLALSGGHFIGCPEKLLIQHATAAPDKSPEVNLEAEQRLAQKYKNYLDQIGYFKYALIWPKVRYHHYKREYLKMFFTFISLFIRHPFKASSHIFETGPKRLLHEFKMSKKKS